MITSNVLEISNRTKKDAERKLNEYGICNIIRPVGFGKTYILTDIATKGLYKNVLYFYPRNIIRDQIELDYIDKLKNSRNNVYFYSYGKLSRCAGDVANTDWLKDLEGSLFIFDESHFVGGDKVSQAFNELKRIYKGKCHFLGASANEVRDLGKVDTTAMYFEGVSTFYYDMNNAIEDGVYPKPVYIYNVFDVEDTKEGVLELTREQSFISKLDEKSKIEYKNFLSKKVLEVSSLLNSHKIFKDNIEKYVSVENRKYMKFFAYFLHHEELDNRTNELVESMSKAFPGMKVVLTKVTSREGENDLSRVTGLKRREGIIDIVASIDMLSYGYHVDDITGIIMYRGTESDIVFQQQSQRGLSIVSKTPSIIFDMVGNFSKAIQREFKGLNPKIIKGSIPNSGGKGFIKPKNITLISYEKDVRDLYTKLNVDKVVKFNKLLGLYTSGRMPIEVVCREMGFTDESVFERYYENVCETMEVLGLKWR